MDLHGGSAISIFRAMHLLASPSIRQPEWFLPRRKLRRGPSSVATRTGPNSAPPCSLDEVGAVGIENER